MASITLKNINKIYPGGFRAVNNVNLEIKDKEFVVLVGPSGCGKSTTLRMIAGLEDVTQGELYIGDKMVNFTPPKDRDIAMVFQSYALYPDKTVYKNMAFGLERHKVPKDEIKRRVDEAAKILGIEHLLDRKPKALSGGQRQRVALGRAIVRDPKVFLLDEPLSNLDAKLRTAMRTEIAKLHKRLDTTFVYVTHDQTEAMTMGDRIVVMKDGVVQQADTPHELYINPCNMFVAGFIGSPQMNFVDAVMKRKEGSYYLETQNGTVKLPDSRVNENVSAYEGKKIKIGVRPEDVSDEPGKENVLTGTVEVSEQLGSEVYLYISSPDGRITARVSPDTTAKTGSIIKYTFNMNKIHLFDPQTQEAVR
ncbi:MAG: ABC transporter ATP-binding protein [Clostridia bacterium]|nr:ABC transporter ATP-binding protein [Clostridia bacterium]